MATGHYIYIDHLLCLAGRRPSHPIDLPQHLWPVNTPLNPRAWASHLQSHPDRAYVDYIVQGIHHGFRLGFAYGAVKLRSASRNMRSAEENPEVVEQYLAKECGLGRVVGPLEPDVRIHVSRFGVIPKSHQPGKWRLIVDLSAPKGFSVNDGIPSELCSLSYASVDDAVQRIMSYTRGALLAKLDIESAYRIIPVHPDDRPLLGMMWKGRLYVDTSLPFGLRSAPKLFNALADGLSWILRAKGTRDQLHYLDDFLFIGAPNTEECKQALECALSTCAILGIPVATQKVEGPSTCLSFLGIELDTQALQLRLPVEKLRRLQALIKSWQGKKTCLKRDLLSLIGQLQHACRVVKPGRTFLRRMISLSTVAKEPHHHIRLNKNFQSDLEWWAVFLPGWNGIGMMSNLCHLPHSALITSDASGGWGCGAFNSANQWFQAQWPKCWSSVHITVKELAPIVVACALWGNQWRGATVLCRCDNAAVVSIVNSGSSKDPLVMHLMRSLFFITAVNGISLYAQHIPGKHNNAADALSRNHLPLFHQQVPSADSQPTPIPPELWQILVLSQPDWTSRSWRNQFACIFQRG